MVRLKDLLVADCVHYYSEASALADFFATAMEKHDRDDPFWIESGFCRTPQDVSILYTAITALVAAIQAVDGDDDSNPIEKAFALNTHLLHFFMELIRFQSFQDHLGNLFGQ